MNISMNTAPDLSNPVHAILEKLDLLTANMSVSQLLNELQLSIERLGFSGLIKQKNQNDEEFIAQVNLLFEGDLSDQMLSFISWLCQNNLLAVLDGRVGQLFLNHCIKVYSKATEVHFITPIALNLERQFEIINKLRRIYPAPVRIICEVSPSLRAGFVINDGTKTVDRSLRTCMAKTIRPVLVHKTNMQRLNYGQ